MKTLISLSALLLGFIVVGYNGCGKSENKTEQESTFEAPPGLPPINYTSEPLPAVVCGQSGWDFMRRNYIVKHCGSCHYNGSTIAPFDFGDDDSALAYSEALRVAQNRWHVTTTQNRFCFPDCNIRTDGEIYYALMQWSQNRTCP